jgi:hypothetical protein
MSNASANIVNFCVIRFILSSLFCDLLLSGTNCIERWKKSQGGEDLVDPLGPKRFSNIIKSIQLISLVKKGTGKNHSLAYIPG